MFSPYSRLLFEIKPFRNEGGGYEAQIINQKTFNNISLKKLVLDDRMRFAAAIKSLHIDFQLLNHIW